MSSGVSGACTPNSGIHGTAPWRSAPACYGCLPRFCGLLAPTSVLILLLSVIFPLAAASAEQGDGGKRPDRHIEIWSGADAGADFWLAYTGATLAPFGDIHETGWRLRLVGGYGRYRYQSFSPTTGSAQEHSADAAFADVLVGYLWRLDPLILKLFIGGAFSEHQINPIDASNFVQGQDVGLKGVAEVWFNIDENSFASVDLSWSQAHKTRTARARLGYRVTPALSVGPEIGLNLDRQGDFKIEQERTAFRAEPIDYGRIGAFARYEWYGGEVSGSVGFLGDFRSEQSVYGTVNWISQF